MGNIAAKLRAFDDAMNSKIVFGAGCGEPRNMGEDFEIDPLVHPWGYPPVVPGFSGRHKPSHAIIRKKWNS